MPPIRHTDAVSRIATATATASRQVRRRTTIAFCGPPAIDGQQAEVRVTSVKTYQSKHGSEHTCLLVRLSRRVGLRCFEGR